MESRTREEVLDDLRREFSDCRAMGVDLSLDSDEIRASQVEKTSDRLDVVRNLRLDSLARSTLERVGLVNT